MDANIHVLGFPGAVFDSAAALAEFRSDAERYEAAVSAYAAGGDEADLWEALGRLGVNRLEIQWHVDQPGKRMRRGFA